VHLRAELDAPVPPVELFVWVGALERYPDWLEIVRSVDPAADDPAAWDVVLVGRLGPLRRSKRLRMVCLEHQAPTRARFARRELDGRDHARWDLAVEVAPTAGGSHLTMDLSYSGNLWGPALHRLISNEIDAAKPRLVALAQGSGTRP
jgi:hypothetical protein